MALLVRNFKGHFIKTHFLCSRGGSTIAKKKTTSIDRALKHFDDFYSKVYGATWENIRAALLREQIKYMAVVNNFSDGDRIQNYLESQGAMNIKSIYGVFKNSNQTKDAKKKQNQIPSLSKTMDKVLVETQSLEVQSKYPPNYDAAPASLNLGENIEHQKDTSLKEVEMRSIENTEDRQLETHRIIDPSFGPSALNDFIPVTKLKGMEDWVLESDHYKYYQQGADFFAEVHREQHLTIPEHLQVYTFEAENYTKFPSPRPGSTGVLDYYLFDGGSLLPVLALDLQPGDMVLDMCAAPGGKALTALQTLMPRLLVANDISASRTDRINKVLQEFISDVGSWEKRLFVTQQDARRIQDENIYNKILCDVPCTTDRHVLHSEDNNIFKSTRVKERLRLPELQADILTNALKLVTVGGTVVYSTCSLSPIQNDGVVQMALKKAWELTNSIMIVKDMTEALEPLGCLYKFGDFGLKYGHLVIPTKKNNLGPMYLYFI